MAHVPVFVNKVLLKYSYAHLLCIAYDCFHATTAELSSYNRPYGRQSLKHLLCGP